MSTLKVNTIRHTGASSDAVTLATDGTCTAKITNNLSNRNIIINGACNVAQRSTSAVTDDSYRTVDRFALGYGGIDEHPTQERHALTSSDTGPWEKGFRHSFHVTNGNQTNGFGASDFFNIKYIVEAQDMASSGWNYTSASSYITLSFWVKSSVAQNFYGYIKSQDGTFKHYAFETGSLSANTWTKITKTIPGHADITFNNDNGQGLIVELIHYTGTTESGSVTLNQWATFNGSLRTPDQTSTWWTTNDATIEVTGVQLEVGDVATDFEHRSYSDELARCQRYFEICADGRYGNLAGSGNFKIYTTFKTIKRASPTLTLLDSAENCVSSVTMGNFPGGINSEVYGARIIGAVDSTGDNKYVDARFSADSEL